MMRKGLRFLTLLVFALAFVPVKAYAWDFLPDGQMWAGDVGSNHCATVHAGEIYDAATYAVGSDPNKVSASVRVKLSDPSYGGRFYQYAQTFEKMESWDDYPEWLPAYVGVAQMISNGLVGDFNIYNSEASISLYEGAMIDFRRVLAGDDLGGGSGGGNVFLGDYISVDLQSFENNYSKYDGAVDITATNATLEDGFLVVGDGVTKCNGYIFSSHYVNDGVVYISQDVANFVNSLISEGYKVSFISRGLFASRSLYSTHGFNPADPTNTSYTISYLRSNDPILSYSCVYSSYYYDGRLFFFIDSASSSSSTLSKRWSTPQYFSDVIDTPFSLPPSGDWPEPETPVTPDPPEVPTPTAPTVTPDPTPTEPTVVWPTAPIVVNPPEVTVEVTPTGLDYTELLTRINDNLNSIDSYAQAINSGLNSLRPDIIGGFDDVVSAIRNIYRYLQHLDDILERHCKHLRDALDDGIYNLELYIKSLFQWLPNQLNYDAEFTYDDSAVTTLLRRILNKIPGGSTDIPVSYEPNPQADEPGFFDWLLDLWHRFLIDLVSVLPDELGALVDAFSQLTHYFPFSIPWDLFALLSLFEHEPVTPVFDVPWGFGGDEGEIQMVRVDLSAWDGVMEMVRPVFLVGFCWQLAMITKDLLANFDINKGGV